MWYFGVLVSPDTEVISESGVDILFGVVPPGFNIDSFDKGWWEVIWDLRSRVVVLDLGDWQFFSIWVKEFDLSIRVSTTLEHGEGPWLEFTLVQVEFLGDSPFSIVWVMGVWSSILEEDLVDSISIL